MDFEVIKKIIKIAEDADISGLTVEQGDLKIEVKREKAIAAPAIHSTPVPIAAAHTPAPLQKDEEDPNLLAITSPMVGTFYRSPSPDSSPFIELGDKVEPGKVVCIIEAMKLFNEIESEVKGEVTKILVENGQPVEYGQKLFLVKKG